MTILVLVSFGLAIVMALVSVASVSSPPPAQRRAAAEGIPDRARGRGADRGSPPARTLRSTRRHGHPLGLQARPTRHGAGRADLGHDRARWRPHPCPAADRSARANHPASGQEVRDGPGAQRTCATRLPPASTTAVFIAQPRDSAFASACWRGRTARQSLRSRRAQQSALRPDRD
jgi:hypothetical protein